MLGIRNVWIDCHNALDELDKEWEQHGIFHTDICCCDLCKACDKYESLNMIQKLYATIRWGKP